MIMVIFTHTNTYEKSGMRDVLRNYVPNRSKIRIAKIDLI